MVWASIRVHSFMWQAHDGAPVRSEQCVGALAPSHRHNWAEGSYWDCPWGLREGGEGEAAERGSSRERQCAQAAGDRACVAQEV
jgi:hypothetical protein